MLEEIISIVRRAGGIVRGAHDVERVTSEKSCSEDLVTEYAPGVQAFLRRELLALLPEADFFGEEGEHQTMTKHRTFIVDPIDGTTNFIHGVPQYAHSIALCRRGEPVVAVVYDVAKNELFTAVKGEGAFLVNRRIRVSENSEMRRALIGTGFPFRKGDNFKDYMQSFMRVTQATAGVRRPGAASLDLAWVAAGRYDGFWESGLSKWDIAAGGLLVFEAGGLLTDLEGGEEWLEKGSVCCGNPKIFGQLLPLVGKLPAPEAKTDEAKEESAAEGDAK